MANAGDNDLAVVRLAPGTTAGDRVVGLIPTAWYPSGVALDPMDDLRVLASRTPGFTGADLANVVNEAALLAARREKNSVGMDELEEAIDRTIAGLERKSRVMSEKDKVRVATHEMGHALVGLRLKHIDPVHRVTIIPRGAAALGITMTRPLEDRYIMTEPELLDRLAFALGGRTAEETIFQEISTGAADDFAAYIGWEQQQPEPDANAIAQRQQWIADLKAGRAPFDKATLDELRVQS